jgi:hypothetical protein
MVGNSRLNDTTNTSAAKRRDGLRARTKTECKKNVDWARKSDYRYDLA